VSTPHWPLLESCTGDNGPILHWPQRDKTGRELADKATTVLATRQGARREVRVDPPLLIDQVHRTPPMPTRWDPMSVELTVAPAHDSSRLRPLFLAGCGVGRVSRARL
jgi:hypothetical protein